MKLPPIIGTIAFYDTFEEEVAEVSIEKIEITQGQPPKLVFVGPLLASTRLWLTPEVIEYLNKLLNSAASLNEPKASNSNPTTNAIQP
jgi:hypothetical protein